MKTKKATIHVPLYHSGVQVHLGSYEAVVREYERRGGSRFDDCEGRCANFDDQYSFVFVRSQATRAKTIAVLTHEMCHAASWILTRSGVRWGHDNQEPFTFLVESLVEGAASKLRL